MQSKPQYDAMLVEPNRSDPEKPFEYPIEIHGYDTNGEVVGAVEPIELTDKAKRDNLQRNFPEKLQFPLAVPHMPEVKDAKGRVRHSGSIPFEVTGRGKDGQMVRVTIKNCYAVHFGGDLTGEDLSKSKKIRRFFNVEIHYHGKRGTPVRKGYKHAVSIQDDMPQGGSIAETPYIRPFNSDTERDEWNRKHPGDGINRGVPVQMTNDDADKKAAAEKAAAEKGKK